MARSSEATKTVITDALSREGIPYTYQSDGNFIAFMLEQPSDYDRVLKPVLRYLGNRVGVARYPVPDSSKIIYVIKIQIPENPLFEMLIEHERDFRERGRKMVKVVLDKTRADMLFTELTWYEPNVENIDDTMEEVRDYLFDLIAWAAITTPDYNDAHEYVDVMKEWAMSWNDPDVEDAMHMVTSTLLWESRRIIEENHWLL